MTKLSEQFKTMAGEQGGANDMGVSMIEMERRIREEIGPFIDELVRDAVSKIQVSDGTDGRDGIDGVDGQDGSPDSPNVVKTKLETLKGDERLDASAIKNLPRLIETLGTSKKGGGGGSTLRIEDLSSQANGSATTFTTSRRIGSNHVLLSSSFPTVWLPTTDYSVSNITITLAAGVPVPQSGQSFVFIYEDAT